MFNIYLLSPYWSQKIRILYTPFFWHSIGWVEIFIFSFSFEKYESDIYRVTISEVPSWRFDEAKSKSMYRRIFKTIETLWYTVCTL